MPTGQIGLRWLPQPGLPGLRICLGRRVDLIASQRPRSGAQERVDTALLNDDARNLVSEALLKEIAQVSDRLSVEVEDLGA